MKKLWIRGGRVPRQVRVVVPLAAVIVTMTIAGCGDSCDCPGEGVWVRDCVGWIAPVCGTYCMEAGTGTATIIPDCCCEGSGGKPSMPTDPTAGTGGPVATPSEPGASRGESFVGVWRPIAAPCR